MSDFIRCLFLFAALLLAVPTPAQAHRVKFITTSKTRADLVKHYSQFGYMPNAKDLTVAGRKYVWIEIDLGSGLQLVHGLLYERRGNRLTKRLHMKPTLNCISLEAKAVNGIIIVKGSYFVSKGLHEYEVLQFLPS